MNLQEQDRDAAARAYYDAFKAAEARVIELEATCKDAIEFADEGWAYASEYFIEKWDYKGQRERLCARLKGRP